MKQANLLIMVLVLAVSNNYTLAQSDINRCWTPNDDQVEIMKIFKEATEKVSQRVDLTSISISDFGNEVMKETTSNQAQRQDPAFIRAAMECGVLSLYKNSSFLNKNKEFALNLVKQGHWYNGHLDESLLKDWEIALAAIKYDNFAPWNLPINLKTNRDFILTALRENPHHGWDILSSVSWQSDDRETVLLAVKSYGGILSQVNERFWKDKEIVLAAVKSQKAHYNRRVSQGEERFENNNVLEDVANGRDIPLLNDPDVIKAANTKEVEILPFQESCPNHCSRYK